MLGQWIFCYNVRVIFLRHGLVFSKCLQPSFVVSLLFSLRVLTMHQTWQHLFHQAQTDPCQQHTASSLFRIFASPNGSCPDIHGMVTRLGITTDTKIDTIFSKFAHFDVQLAQIPILSSWMHRTESHVTATQGRLSARFADDSQRWNWISALSAHACARSKQVQFPPQASPVRLDVFLHLDGLSVLQSQGPVAHGSLKRAGIQDGLDFSHVQMMKMLEVPFFHGFFASNAMQASAWLKKHLWHFAPMAFTHCIDSSIAFLWRMAGRGLSLSSLRRSSLVALARCIVFLQTYALRFCEITLSQCSRPYGTATCILQTADWLGTCQSILTQVEHSNEASLVCRRISLFSAIRGWPDQEDLFNLSTHCRKKMQTVFVLWTLNVVDAMSCSRLRCPGASLPGTPWRLALRLLELREGFWVLMLPLSAQGNRSIPPARPCDCLSWDHMSRTRPRCHHEIWWKRLGDREPPFRTRPGGDLRGMLRRISLHWPWYLEALGCTFEDGRFSIWNQTFTEGDTLNTALFRTFFFMSMKLRNQNLEGRILPPMVRFEHNPEATAFINVPMVEARFSLLLSFLRAIDFLVVSFCFQSNLFVASDLLQLSCWHRLEFLPCFVHCCLCIRNFHRLRYRNKLMKYTVMGYPSTPLCAMWSSWFSAQKILDVDSWTHASPRYMHACFFLFGILLDSQLRASASWGKYCFFVPFLHGIAASTGTSNFLFVGFLMRQVWFATGLFSAQFVAGPTRRTCSAVVGRRCKQWSFCEHFFAENKTSRVTTSLKNQTHSTRTVFPFLVHTSSLTCSGLAVAGFVCVNFHPDHKYTLGSFFSFKRMNFVNPVQTTDKMSDRIDNPIIVNPFLLLHIRICVSGSTMALGNTRPPRVDVALFLFMNASFWGTLLFTKFSVHKDALCTESTSRLWCVILLRENAKNHTNGSHTFHWCSSCTVFETSFSGFRPLGDPFRRKMSNRFVCSVCSREDEGVARNWTLLFVVRFPSCFLLTALHSFCFFHRWQVSLFFSLVFFS